MKHARLGTAALTLAVLLPLAGCGTDSETPTSGTTSQPSTTETTGADLATADSDLGQIVVDGTGMTAYYFTSDTPGSGNSTCADECLAAWPAISPAGTEPVVDGVTAEVAVITGTDGEPQLTLDGRPVYTYAGDEAAGDTNGQGLNGAWYVVAPDGTEITAAPGADTGY